MVTRVYENVVEQRGRRRRDGTRPVTYYYRVRNKGEKALWIRIPGAPGDDAFEARYREITSEADTPSNIPFSFDALITSYRKSSEYKSLAARTKKDYDAILNLLGEWLGKKNASLYPRKEVIRMRDANQHRPRRANYCVQVLSILMERAIDLDWRKDNPASRVKKLKTGPGYRPWTEIEIEKYRNAATGMEALIFEVALGTGQRPGALPTLRWSDYDGETIRVAAHKTNPEMWIPPTKTLRRILDDAKRIARGLTILTNEHGQPFTYDTMEKTFRAARDRAGVEGPSLHGLRKNATVELVETGCTNEEIKAVTGHTTDVMVALYAKGAKQKRLAKAARQR